MDEVSSYGYAWGYIGSCIPFGSVWFWCWLVSPSAFLWEAAMVIAFFIIALWWLLGAVPLLAWANPLRGGTA